MDYNQQITRKLVDREVRSKQVINQLQDDIHDLQDQLKILCDFNDDQNASIFNFKN